MANKDNSDLVGYGITAVIAAVFIYHFWKFFIGGLALFGIAFVIRELANRNDRNR